MAVTGTIISDAPKLPAGAARGGVKPPPPPAAGGKGAPHVAPRPQGTAGHWVQQGGKWALIHAVGPGHWVQGPKPGFGAPPKPKAPSAAPTPDYLQPLTPQQVKAQATQTVQAAYKPALQQLDQQSSQEQAIMAKQNADNQFYQQWLDAKSNSLQVNQQAVDQSTQQLEQQLTGNQATEMAAQASGLTAAANARAGNVSNNAPAFEAGSPLGNELAANQSSQQQIEGGAATRSLEGERIAQQELGAATANTGAYLQAGRMKEQANFDNAMKTIANTRATTSTRETADIQKEIARLQGVQINVAENNRNYAAAATKLGLQTAVDQNLINTRTQNANTAAQNASTSAAKAIFDRNPNAIGSAAWDKVQAQANHDKTYQLDVKRFGLETAKDLYQRAHRTGPYAQSGSAADKPLTSSEQNTVYDHVTKVRNDLQAFVALFEKWGAPSSGPKSAATQAWHALHDGKYYGQVQVPIKNASGQTTGYKTKWQWIITKPSQSESDTGILNAAFNTRAGGPGLTAGDVAYLTKNYHLTDPKSRLG